MTTYETRTALLPTEVLAHARAFFALAGTPYAAFQEESGAGHLRLHLEVGEVLIGVSANGSETLVRGSASRGSHLLSRFMSTIGHPTAVQGKVRRYGTARRDVRPALGPT